MNRRVFVVTLAAAATAPRLGAAQTISLQDAIARLFTASTLEAAWFTPAMLAAAPLATTRSIIDGSVATLGPYRSIAPNGKRFTVTFERGSIQAEGSLDGAGAIDGLFFSRMQSAAAAQALTTLFTVKPVPETLFSDRFLAAVPIDKSRLLAVQLQQQFGSFSKAAPAKDGSYDIVFANGLLTALIFLGPSGKIEGLSFQPH